MRAIEKSRADRAAQQSLDRQSLDKTFLQRHIQVDDEAHTYDGPAALVDASDLLSLGPAHHESSTPSVKALTASEDPSFSTTSRGHQTHLPASVCPSRLATHSVDNRRGAAGPTCASSAAHRTRGTRAPSTAEPPSFSAKRAGPQDSFVESAKSTARDGRLSSSVTKSPAPLSSRPPSASALVGAHRSAFGFNHGRPCDRIHSELASSPHVEPTAAIHSPASQGTNSGSAPCPAQQSASSAAVPTQQPGPDAPFTSLTAAATQTDRPVPPPVNYKGRFYSPHDETNLGSGSSPLQRRPRPWSKATTAANESASTPHSSPTATSIQLLSSTTDIGIGFNSAAPSLQAEQPLWGTSAGQRPANVDVSRTGRLHKSASKDFGRLSVYSAGHSLTSEEPSSSPKSNSTDLDGPNNHQSRSAPPAHDPHRPTSPSNAIQRPRIFFSQSPTTRRSDHLKPDGPAALNGPAATQKASKALADNNIQLASFNANHPQPKESPPTLMTQPLQPILVQQPLPSFTVQQPLLPPSAQQPLSPIFFHQPSRRPRLCSHRKWSSSRFRFNKLIQW